MEAISRSTMPPTPLIDANSLGTSAGGPSEEVAKSFEAVFASLLIKEMRSTLSDGLFGSESSDVLGGLFDLHMGKAMTEGRGLGIKQMVLAQWDREAPPQS